MRTPLLLSAVSLLLVSADCNKNPDFNPCEGKEPFAADFTIEEKVGDTSFVTDKALAPGYVFFKAQGDYDSVRWIIGGPQNTSTKLQHVLYFENPEGSINVTFIGYRKPDTQCFPNDNGIDTVQKTFTVIRRDQNADIVGNFFGYNESNPADTFTVSVIYYDDVWGYFVKNLPKNCPGYTTVGEAYPRNIGLNVAVGNSGFEIDDNSVVCSTVKGYGSTKGTDTLEINYSTRPILSTNPYTYGEQQNFKFKGLRKP